jgi:hypothetical protein
MPNTLRKEDLGLAPAEVERDLLWGWPWASERGTGGEPAERPASNIEVEWLPIEAQIDY